MSYLDDNPKTMFGQAKPGIADIPPIALLIQGMAHRDGKQKYGRMNWREKTVTASIYYEAANRHMSAWWDGEECASDSGVHHLGHAIACLNIMIDMIFMEQVYPDFEWNDDRPPRGSMPLNIGSLTWPVDPETGKPTKPVHWDEDLADTVEKTQTLSELLLRDMTNPIPVEIGLVDITQMPGVRASISKQELTDKMIDFRDRVPDGESIIGGFYQHLGVISLADLDQLGRTHMAFYMDARKNGADWLMADMDDMLSRVIGGEQ